MKNTFYNAFDVDTLNSRKHRKEDLRTPFQVDRDRIIYSAAFRNLQSKTQVFHTGEYDFYRTRLTHSLEVAQIGRGICNHLLHRKPLRADFFIDPDLVEACCLAHDIGHPPFGHAGESALNEVLSAHGGFEGNAQTLRILSDLIFGPDGGMRPTRALLDGVLKYKKVFIDPKKTSSKFLYAEQQEILDFVYAHPSWAAADLASCRSIECQIMDWADDVAYGLMDIVDGFNAHFLTIDNLKKWRKGKSLKKDQIKIFAELVDDISEGKLDRPFAKHIGDCITGTSLVRSKSPLRRQSNRYAFDLVVNPSLRERVDFYKWLSVDLIFHTPQIKQLEYKGRNILTKLFVAFNENYTSGKKRLELLPKNVEAEIDKDPIQTQRLLGDYLSSLTDAACIRIYRRLFDPAYGSFTDLY